MDADIALLEEANWPPCVSGFRIAAPGIPPALNSDFVVEPVVLKKLHVYARMRLNGELGLNG